MSDRRLYLDEAPGERRGVVTLKGRPERLLLERQDVDPGALCGARLVGRVTSIEHAMGSAFVALGRGPDAVMDLKPDMPPLTQGQAVLVEVRAEARAEKGATVRFADLAEGAPRLVTPAPGLADQLQGYDRAAAIVRGAAAREAADIAEAEALEAEFPLPQGGRIFVEPTRALVAIDVDLGASPMKEAKRAARQANLAALGVAARILRLKGLGGLVVIDLVGRGHDGAALLAAARAAFAPDNPGVAIGPIGRFGTLELTVPRRRRPVLEMLTDAGGRPSDATLALRMLRAIEREASAQPGARLRARCAPQIAAAARAGVAPLIDRFGPRIAIEPVDALSRDQTEITPW